MRTGPTSARARRRPKVRAILHGICSGCIGAALSACAGAPSSAPPLQHLTASDLDEEPKAISDPYEKLNRAVFEGNQKFNHALLYPVAKAYNESVPPQSVRDRVESFTANLGEPVVFANDVLQLRFKAAATTLGRAGLNSTLGLGGLFDVASTQGLAKQSGDFGQTMYVWGYRESAYLVLPVLGPTNVRDAIGTGIEFGVQQIPTAAVLPSTVATIANNVNLTGTITGPLTNISKAGDMQNLEESSIDFYSMLRSVSSQKRQADLQEALDTSALTSTAPAESNVIEPVMEIASSPSLREITSAKNARPGRPQHPSDSMRVLVGPPAAGGSNPDPALPGPAPR